MHTARTIKRGSAALTVALTTGIAIAGPAAAHTGDSTGSGGVSMLIGALAVGGAATAIAVAARRMRRMAIDLAESTPIEEPTVSGADGPVR